MTCRLCNKTPIKVLRDLDRDINEGEVSILELAKRYELPPKRIRTHMRKCLGGVPQTGYSILQSNLRSLRKLYSEVKEEYDSVNPYDEEPEKAKGFAMQRLLNIRKEEREHVMALDRIKPSDQLADEILNSVATPFVLSTTDICTQELARLRKELVAQFGADSILRIDTAIKEALLRIGDLLSQEVNQITPSLKKILNTEYSQRRKSKGDSDRVSH